MLRNLRVKAHLKSTTVTIVTSADTGRAVEIERASTLELFLDLVFVFTVTQLTELVGHPDGLGDYGKALLILLTTFWMYDGYVWLTGTVSLARPATRIAIFAAMAGFLLMAMAIPTAFGATEESAFDGGVAFGAAYLGVTLIHAGLFSTGPTSSAAAIWRIAPFNLVSAGFVLAAGFVDEDWRWVLWLAAVATTIAVTVMRREQGFTISAAHFVERHGLVIIVALGESIVAIGGGAAGLEIDVALAATAALALALSASMWWLYFDRDDERAGQVMAGTASGSRARLGMWIAYSHVVMVAGVVLMAAGVKSVVAHPTDPAETAAAWNVGAGTALYLLGEVWFRSSLGIGAWVRRLAAAVLLVATIPVALEVSGLAQLAVAVVIVVTMIIFEAREPNDTVGTGATGRTDVGRALDR
jgi:low temperature requirement protein LtrA